MYCLPATPPGVAVVAAAAATAAEAAADVDAAELAPLGLSAGELGRRVETGRAGLRGGHGRIGCGRGGHGLVADDLISRLTVA